MDRNRFNAEVRLNHEPASYRIAADQYDASLDLVIIDRKKIVVPAVSFHLSVVAGPKRETVPDIYSCTHVGDYRPQKLCVIGIDSGLLYDALACLD